MEVFKRSYNVLGETSKVSQRYIPVATKRATKKGSITRREKRTPKRQHYVPTDPEILDAEGAAAMLGVSVRYMVRLAREGTVPAKKVGRQWRFLRSA